MNLLDDYEMPEQRTRISLSREATKLIGNRRPTRRGKKKVKVKSIKWNREYNEAMKQHKEMKKKLAEHWGDANRLMEK